MSKASYSEWGRLSWKPDGSIGLGHNHSHLTDSTAAILGNHERGVQAGSQLKLQCRILKMIQPHDKPPLDKTMKWLHNGQKVRDRLLLLTAELLSKIMLGRHDFIFCARAASVSRRHFFGIEERQPGRLFFHRKKSAAYLSGLNFFLALKGFDRAAAFFFQITSEDDDSSGHRIGISSKWNPEVRLVSVFSREIGHKIFVFLGDGFGFDPNHFHGLFGRFGTLYVSIRV